MTTLFERMRAGMPKAQMPRGLKVGDRVRFTLATSRGPRTYEATIRGFRKNGKAGVAGWVETCDDNGFNRSVQPARCELIESPADEGDEN